MEAQRPKVSSVPCEFGEFIPCVLKELHHEDEYDDRYHHHIRIEALVAVAYRDVAQPPSADRSCHCGVADEVYKRQSEPCYDCRQPLGQQNFVYYLKGSRPH